VYRLGAGIKDDPARRWALPDRVFFACGACHILAYAFLRKHGLAGRRALWLKPAAGFTGNHIVVDGGEWVFDYHGYSRRPAFMAHLRRKAARWWPGWSATEVPLAPETLVSEARSREYEGLWLREPGQFLHDALPRADMFVAKFQAPPVSVKGSS
jgi:hypothetical protein